jgi:hypothetical protein
MKTWREKSYEKYFAMGKFLKWLIKKIKIGT